MRMVKSFFFVKNKSKIAIVLTLSVSAIPFIVTQEAHFGGSHPNKSLRILGRDKETEVEDLLSSIEDKYFPTVVSFRSQNKILSTSQEFEILKLQGMTAIVQPFYKGIKIQFSSGAFTRPKYLDVVSRVRKTDRIGRKIEEKKSSSFLSTESFMEGGTQREERLFENASLSSIDLFPLFEEEDPQRNENFLKAFSLDQFEMLEPLNNFGISADNSITRHHTTAAESEDSFKGWEEKSIFTPMSGNVVFNVQEGDFVGEKTELYSLEAMKMIVAIRNVYGDRIYIKSIHRKSDLTSNYEGEVPIMTVLIPPKKSSAILKEEDDETRS